MLYSKISIVLFSGLILIVTQLFFLSLLWQNANDEMLKIVIASAYLYSLLIIIIQILLIYFISKLEQQYFTLIILAFILTLNLVFFVEGFNENFLKNLFFTQLFFILIIFLLSLIMLIMMFKNLVVCYSCIVILLISTLIIIIFRDNPIDDKDVINSKLNDKLLGIKFDKKPDLFVLIYDSMISKKSAQQFLNVSPKYYNILRGGNIKVYKNSFVERIPTRPSLKVFMGLGNDELPYGMINGQKDSPLASIFRNNGYKIIIGTRQGYEINTSYKSAQLQNEKNFIDEYYYDKQEMYKASPICINIPKSGFFLKFERFYYFCSLFSWIFDKDQTLEGWPVQVKKIINRTHSIKEPTLTILYLYHPIGHTGLDYDAKNKKQKNNYRDYFIQSSEFLSSHLEEISNNIFSANKESFLLVFGDHGTFSGKGNYKDKYNEVLDKYGVFTALFGNEINCVSPELLEDENRITSPTRVMISLIDCLQLRGERYLDIIDYNFISEIEDEYNFLPIDFKKLESVD